MTFGLNIVIQSLPSFLRSRVTVSGSNESFVVVSFPFPLLLLLFSGAGAEVEMGGRERGCCGVGCCVGAPVGVVEEGRERAGAGG